MADVRASRLRFHSMTARCRREARAGRRLLASTAATEKDYDPPGSHVALRRASERQYTAPRAVIGQSCSTRLLRTQTYQSPLPNPPPLAGEGRVGVEVDGGVAVAGDQADLVAEREAVGGGGDGEPAVFVGGALVGRGGLVANDGRARIEGQRLEAGVDDGAVLGRTAHLIGVDEGPKSPSPQPSPRERGEGGPRDAGG